MCDSFLLHSSNVLNTLFKDVEILADNFQFINGPISIIRAVSIGVVCSLVMLIIGFVCGIVTKTMIERRTKHTGCSTTTQNPIAPASTSTLYENVKISETNPQSELFDVNVNQAYEPIPVSTCTST